MADKVTVGKPKKGGAIYVAPYSDTLTLPTDSTTAMSTFTSFKSLGYVSEDGLVNANSPESDSVKAWGGDTVLNTQSSKDDKFTFTLIDSLDKNVLEFIYGADNVDGSLSAGLEVTATTDESADVALVVDMIVGKTGTKRIVVPKCAITEIGEISYTDTDAVGYEVTVTASAIEGVTHYEYMKK